MFSPECEMHDGHTGVTQTKQRIPTLADRRRESDMPPRRRSVLLTQLVIDAPGSPQQTILDELRRVILSGSAPPGTPIPLGDVADVFGVSRIPVRESLKTLVGESLVDHRHQFGYTVAQLTPAELREMYIVRETLESAALAVAVEQATEEDHEHAVEVNSRLEIALRYDDSQSYHCESRNFHLALTRPSQMLRLLHMFEAAWNITEPVQPMVPCCRRRSPGSALGSHRDAGRIPASGRIRTSERFRNPSSPTQYRDRDSTDRHRSIGRKRYTDRAIVVQHSIDTFLSTQFSSLTLRARGTVR